MGLKVAVPRYFLNEFEKWKKPNWLFYEAVHIYILQVNASHTKIKWSNDKAIIGLGRAKYRDLSLSRKLIIWLSLWLRQIMNLLATDKSLYFAQPSPIIVNYFWKLKNLILRKKVKFGPFQNFQLTRVKFKDFPGFSRTGAALQTWTL